MGLKHGKVTLGYRDGDSAILPHLIQIVRFTAITPGRNRNGR